MLDVIATGNYYCGLTDGAPSANLRQQLKPLCSERFRRIDRFTELCLLGSALCRKASPDGLDSRTGIYIGSGFAGIATTVAVQQQLFGDGLIPKPANFINTLSNSAGYYVARNLRLQGQNFFVSRGSASLVAALQMAAMDVEAGIVSQAMVGVVDECDRHRDWHRRRQGLAADAQLAEGSHWFLLQPGGVRSKSRHSSFSAQLTLPGLEALQCWLQQHRGRFSHLYLAADAGSIESALRDEASRLQAFEPPLGHYPSRTAGAVMAWLNQSPGAGLLTVNGDPEGRFHLCLVQESVHRPV
jgi:hypothetical protein